ncbi:MULTISPECIES: hypothetical protein [Methylobacterium]|uniref:Uncharacterized protein n=1 Tax=Methylobacterium brachythecii TaxID=1176177 RepID=A0A7W6F5D2_9HYPH|nr:MULTISPECIES: hypothetical protein [Methylobacterium]MBB3901222.1 hypothetical protein [Methylobacterium brachythecii]GLS44594.1 hypothetical protein GCM10007884_25820 [Methylobacterium brachythecii]
MSSFTLDERVRLSIALGLTAGYGDPALHRRQEKAACRLGMTGAEIDAARHGRSFDMRTSAALALALASASGDRDRVRIERARARRFGIAEAVCDEIEELAARA